MKTSRDWRVYAAGLLVLAALASATFPVRTLLIAAAAVAAAVLLDRARAEPGAPEGMPKLLPSEKDKDEAPYTGEDLLAGQPGVDDDIPGLP